MPEELLLNQNTPESKLWTSLAADPGIVVTQLKPSQRSSVGRVSAASYIPDLSLGDFVEAAGITMPLDGVCPVMVAYSLGRTLLIGDRNIMRYDNVQTLTPGLSVWELPKAGKPVAHHIRSVRVADSEIITNRGISDSPKSVGYLVLSSTTDYLYATGRIENFSQHPVFIAAADDPQAREALGGIHVYGPGRA